MSRDYKKKRLLIERNRIMKDRIETAIKMFDCHGCPWVDRDSKDAFNRFLFNGEVHSINEITTVLALVEHKKNTTSTYIRDLISLVMNELEIYFNSNLIDPDNDDEFIYLTHDSRRRDNYRYFKFTNYTDLWFDIVEYYEIRAPYTRAMTEFYNSVLRDDK